MKTARAIIGWRGPSALGAAVPHLAVAIAGLALLAVSATTAYFIRATVQPAIAQGGPRMAATMPDDSSAGNLLRMPARQAEAVLTLSPSRPIIDRIVFAIGSPTQVHGRAPSLSTVTLQLSGTPIGTASTGADGVWQMAIERGLGVGDHRLQLEAIRFGQSHPVIGDAVRLSVPRGFLSPLELVIADIDGPGGVAGPASLVRVAQAQVEPAKPGKSEPGPVDAIRDWVERAEKTYQDIGVKGISAPKASPAQPGGAPTAVPAPKVARPSPAAQTADSSIVGSVYDWFKRASDSYQATVTRELTQPVAKPPTVAVAPRKAEEPAQAPPPAAQSAPPATQSAPPPSAADLAAEAAKAAESKRTADAKARELLKAAQAEREAELKSAEARRKNEEEAAAKAADLQSNAEDRRLADETRKRQDELKAAQDARVADAARIAAQQAEAAKKLVQETEAKRLLDAQVKREADAKQAEDARLANAAQQAAEAGKKLAQDTEAKRAADLELKRQADARSAEQARQAASLKAAQQAKAKADLDEEAKRVADTRRRAMELAEAASRIVIPGLPDPAKAPLPPLPSVSTRSGPPPAATPSVARRQVAAAPALAPKTDPLPPLPSVSTRPSMPSPGSQTASRAASPPTRPPTAIDRSSRSALGLPQPVRAYVARPGSSAKYSTPCRQAGRKVVPPAYYVVEAGDSLWDIADKHYNDATKVRILERANNLGDEDLIQPCQRVYVPALKSS